jgi:hypothetical protein
MLGMLIKECSPGLYDIFSLEALDLGGSVEHHFIIHRNTPEKIDSSAYNFHQMYFALWIKAIHTGALGMEETSDVVMVPNEKAKKLCKKKPHQIRQIVRIVPKKMKDKTDPITAGGKVDFSHRWEVRGHWRKVNGIGKDREGAYGIHGFTWVAPCVKGPEALPLITKVRWVAGAASA